LFARTSPINALEDGVAGVEAKRRRRRFVNDSVFTDRKLIGHNGRDHPLSPEKIHILEAFSVDFEGQIDFSVARFAELRDEMPPA
jgi:hypothetical protein